jgi:hypothetical protein
MNLATRIANLAAAVAAEIRSRITADHPGVAKAWVCFGCNDAQVTILSAFNVQGVIRITDGRYRVTFATAMKDANYCWQAFARNAGNQSSMKQAAARSTAELKTAEYVDVICTTQAGSFSDTTELNVTVWR